MKYYCYFKKAEIDLKECETCGAIDYYECNLCSLDSAFDNEI